MQQKKRNNLLFKTKDWLQSHGLQVSKRLDQHFLIDEALLERMVSYAELSPDDTVLEIGAGSGTLTKILAKHTHRVYTIEKDPLFAQALKEEFDGDDRISIITGDAVKIEWPNCDKLIANLPYSISSPIIFRFIETQIPLALLMVQQEFAHRLVAQPNTKTYGRLTVMTANSTHIDLLEKVSPFQFFPPPKVYSALVKITQRTTPLFTVENYQLFAQLVTTLFNQRRKKIRTPLRAFLREQGLKSQAIEELAEEIPWIHQRPESLTPKQFSEIANIIHKVVAA
jgi:16S rRNA (adenine1518-N6/adenine1519-N6)-dimethyltransferase